MVICANFSAGVSNTRAACGPRGRSVRPAMLFGNFQIMNIYIAKCLEKRCREIIQSKLNDTQRGFRPGPSTTDQVSLSSNFWEILGLCRRRPHMVCRTRESIGPVFSWKGLWSGAGVGYSVDGRLLLAAKSLFPDQKFVSVSGELNHDRSPLLLLNSDKGVCCHRCFS